MRIDTVHGWVVFQWVLLALVIPATAGFFRAWRQGRVQAAFCVVLLFGYLWALGQHLLSTLRLYMPDEALHLGALYLCYLGMCALGPASVYLAWNYSGKTGLYGSRVKTVALFGTGAVFYLAILTNDAHHLYYTHFSLAGRGYNILFYLFTGFSYACFIYAYITMQRVRIDMEERSTLLYLLCFASPVAANTVGMFLRDPVLDFTPLAYCVMLLGAYLIVWQYRPVSLAPIAARSVFDHMGRPVRVFGPGGEVLYRNGIGEEAGRVYQSSATELEDGNTLLVLTDITELDSALREVEGQEKALREVRLRLEEQAAQLEWREGNAAQLAAEQRRVEIMAALNEQMKGRLQALRENTQSQMDAPDAEGILRGRHLAAQALETARSVVGEIRRRPGDGL